MNIIFTNAARHLRLFELVVQGLSREFQFYSIRSGLVHFWFWTVLSVFVYFF